jgi:uncharacterized protein YndB with AHSA1/START domain
MTVESDADQLSAGPGLRGSVDLARTVGQPVGTVWQALISPQGTGIWLGEGAVLGGKGESYHCTDGSTGVVRSYHPLEQLRVSWHADDYAPATLIEVDLVPDGDTTTVRVHHDGITDAGQRADLEARWSSRLDELATYAAGIG